VQVSWAVVSLMPCSGTHNTSASAQDVACWQHQQLVSFIGTCTERRSEGASERRMGQQLVPSGRIKTYAACTACTIKPLETAGSKLLTAFLAHLFHRKRLAALALAHDTPS
jgi:hypothetical protein